MFAVSEAQSSTGPADPAGTLPVAPTLLLVDDEPNILNALRRVLRHEGYHVLTADGGPEGLAVMARERIDVVLSDQRMPGMTGVEFLRIARDQWPDTVRLVLSGYSELSTVTAAINEGAIYKYLTKPWDDGFLCASVREAFARKALTDENQRLAQALAQANDALGRHNERLQAALEAQRHRLQLGAHLLGMARDGIDCLQVPVVGLDPQGLVAFVNPAAVALAPGLDWQVGGPLPVVLPRGCQRVLEAGQGSAPFVIEGRHWRFDVCPFPDQRGLLLSLIPAASGMPERTEIGTGHTQGACAAARTSLP